MRTLLLTIILCVFAGCAARTGKVATGTSSVNAPQGPRPHPVRLAPQPRLVVDTAAPRSLYSPANIFFDFNKATLRDESIEQLRQIGEQMTIRSFSIEIAGHCDERGSSDYNMGLGLARAQAAKDWLVAYGIAADRITVNSYGKERLAMQNCWEDSCHQVNRRCEFTVKGE